MLHFDHRLKCVVRFTLSQVYHILLRNKELQQILIMAWVSFNVDLGMATMRNISLPKVEFKMFNLK
jgi:hypothetical protein